MFYEDTDANEINNYKWFCEYFYNDKNFYISNRSRIHQFYRRDSLFSLYRELIELNIWNLEILKEFKLLITDCFYVEFTKMDDELTYYSYKTEVKIFDIKQFIRNYNLKKLIEN